MVNPLSEFTNKLIDTNLYTYEQTKKKVYINFYNIIKQFY